MQAQNAVKKTSHRDSVTTDIPWCHYYCTNVKSNRRQTRAQPENMKRYFIAVSCFCVTAATVIGGLRYSGYMLWRCLHKLAHVILQPTNNILKRRHKREALTSPLFSSYVCTLSPVKNKLWQGGQFVRVH